MEEVWYGGMGKSAVSELAFSKEIEIWDPLIEKEAV